MIGGLALIGIAALAIPAFASAADLGDMRTMAKHRVHSSYPAMAGPYPLSWRAAKVRRADRCWHTCLADTGREFQACLKVHRPTDCVNRNAAADRHCLRECRLAGGPWVNVE
jgi:hypothetical protein